MPCGIGAGFSIRSTVASVFVTCLSASTEEISSATLPIPALVRAPRRSANKGDRLTMKSWSTSCHTGRMTLVPLSISRAARPASSRWGHSFEKKCGLKITTPNRVLASAVSICRLRLSPTLRRSSSSHTVQPSAIRASASGRAIAFLSSPACAIKTSLGSDSMTSLIISLASDLIRSICGAEGSPTKRFDPMGAPIGGPRGSARSFAPKDAYTERASSRRGGRRSRLGRHR